MTTVAPIHWVLGRRSRRGTWAYFLWIIPYLLTAWCFAGEMAFHTGARPYQMLPLLIPVLIAAAQIIYPTLLGWTMIFIPSVAYCAFGLYYLVRNATERPPQWENDFAGFILGTFFVGTYLFVCVCLFFARPRRMNGMNAEPNTSPNCGPEPPVDISNGMKGPPSVS